MAIHRGDLFYIFPTESVGCEQTAGRPAIIVSNDSNNKFSKTVEVVYLTTQYKNYRSTHVTIRSSPKESTALCEQIHTVSVERIGDFAGRVTADEMQQIDIALMISLQIDGYFPAEQPVDVPPPQESSIQKQLAEMTVKYNTLKELYDSLLASLLQRS